jgi:ribonuclease HI
MMYATNNININNSSNGLTVLQWNCNGILAHQNEFVNHLNTRKQYDIICLEETFLKPEKFFTVPGYYIVRQDRLCNNKGGLIIMIKKNLKYYVNNPIHGNQDISQSVEFLSVDIKLSKSRFRVVNLYISPGKDITEKDLEFLFGPRTLIIGDVNAKSRLWGSPLADGRGLVLEDLIDRQNAVVLNTGQATYLHHTGSSSHLDVAIVDSDTASQCSWCVLNNAMGSDHCPTVVTVYNKKPFIEIDGSPRFKLSKADWKKFKVMCSNVVTPDLIVPGESIDETNNKITESLISVAKKCIPHTKPGRYNLKHSPLPYWNDTCRKAIYDRNCARNKLKRRNTQENIDDYRTFKGRAQKIIKDAASDHWKSYCNKLNRFSKLSDVWKTTKRMNGVASNNKISSVEHQGEIIDTDEGKAKIFAEYFAKISSDENCSTVFKMYKQGILHNEPPKLSRKDNKQNDELAASLTDSFNLCELRQAIQQTKMQSTPGEDRISYEMLKHIPKQSTAVLLSLYNKVWQCGVFPEAWKHSVIKPVLKFSKPQQKVTSYRPISLTSVLGKVMEKLVTNRISYYVEKENLLNNVQTGFRKGRSTIDQLIRLQDTINKYNHNKGYTAAVFIDFKSAYDMLWHEGLFAKLENMGITGRPLTYIKNFLTDRTMQVRIGNKLSPTFIVKNGTPQGSIISPLLFLIMINDLPDEITKTEASLFADDSCLFTSGRRLDTIMSKMQDSLNKLKLWCDKNGFIISMEKTVAVLFTNRKDDINYRLTIGNDLVAVENKAKFLGLIFDSKLTWNQHTSYIVDKCKKRLNILRAITGNKWGASKKTLLVVYRGLIRSIIEYGSIAYDSMGEANKRKLDSIQSQALRIICGAVRGTATTALQVDLGEPPLQIRRLQQQLQYAGKVFCSKNHPASPVFKSHWTDRSRKYTENTNPIGNKVLEFFSENCSLNWEGPGLPSCPPWRRKVLVVDTSLSKLGNKNENPVALSNIAKDYVDRHRDDLHVYTDGSKTAGSTSAAFYIPELEVTSAVLLPSDLSIFSAELIAIKIGLEWIEKYSEQYSITKNIVLFSDSLSSLIGIKTGSAYSSLNTINDISDLVDSMDVNVKLVWIPSHLGIIGNETVDKLALCARENNVAVLEIPLSLSELNIKIQNYVIMKWQNLWCFSESGKFYREIEPNVSLSILYENKKRKKETTITRLRFGVCLTNDYLYKINVLPSDKCQHCCDSVETVRHLLLECPASSLCNKVLNVCACLNMVPDLKSILRNHELIDTIYENITRAI